jgi:hypothetical protein
VGGAALPGAGIAAIALLAPASSRVSPDIITLQSAKGNSDLAPNSV